MKKHKISYAYTLRDSNRGTWIWMSIIIPDKPTVSSKQKYYSVIK